MFRKVRTSACIAAHLSENGRVRAPLRRAVVDRPAFPSLLDLRDLVLLLRARRPAPVWTWPSSGTARRCVRSGALARIVCRKVDPAVDIATRLS